ncbi:MAG: metal-sensitive transcriptional regulator [Casimicrobiaceae bacterium]
MKPPTFHDETAKRALDARLARVEGQVRGVRRMIAEDSRCEDVALQLAAARKALDRAFYEMISCMIREDLPAKAGARRDHANKVAEILSRFG